jgi:hypothetical protein
MSLVFPKMAAKDKRTSIYTHSRQTGKMCFEAPSEGTPVSNILEIWLDVAEHPFRAREQAEVIWRKIRGPAFEPNG